MLRRRGHATGCKHCWSLLCLAALAAAANGQTILNSSFEELQGELPADWAPANQDPGPALDRAGAQEGAVCVRFAGDGTARSLRQTVPDLPTRPFTITGWVKAQGTEIGPGSYGYIYIHVIYKDQPYGAATHAYHRVEAGTYDWRPVEVRIHPIEAFQIKEILVTCSAKLDAGDVWFDGLGITWSTLGFDLRLLQARGQWLIEGLQGASATGANVAVALTRAGQAQRGAEALAADLQTIPQAEGEARLAALRTEAEAILASLDETGRNAFWAATSTSPQVEIRPIYHGSGSSPEEVSANLDRVQRLGANALYPSLGSWNGVCYASAFAPTLEGWHGNDGLDELIRQGRERGIKIVPYLAVFHAMAGEDGPRQDLPAGYFAVRHPADPQHARAFPSPSHPEVREFMVKLFAELVAEHGPDGIGLDYIRYPDPKALCICDRCRAEVRERYGFDPAEGDPWEDADKARKLWAWRAEHVTRTVRDIAAEARRIKPDILLMAHCISDPDGAARDYGQDWAGFADALDWVTPMNYGPPSDDAGLLTKQATAVRGKCLFVPALGGMPADHAEASPRDWLHRFALARQHGQGVAIYAFSYIKEDTEALLMKGPFRTQAAWPATMGVDEDDQ